MIFLLTASSTACISSHRFVVVCDTLGVVNVLAIDPGVVGLPGVVVGPVPGVVGLPGVVVGPVPGVVGLPGVVVGPVPGVVMGVDAGVPVGVGVIRGVPTMASEAIDMLRREIYVILTSCRLCTSFDIENDTLG